MKRMDNYAITLKIKQTSGGVTDESELFTRGDFRFHKGVYYIDYDETEATGYEGSHAQLKIDDNMMVMTRTGSTFTSLIFECGVRHFCHYGTDFGDCMVGITTDFLKSDLSSCGGNICVKYAIDVNSGLMTENEINIKVRASDNKQKRRQIVKQAPNSEQYNVNT